MGYFFLQPHFYFRIKFILKDMKRQVYWEYWVYGQSAMKIAGPTKFSHTCLHMRVWGIFFSICSVFGCLDEYWKVSGGPKDFSSSILFVALALQPYTWECNIFSGDTLMLLAHQGQLWVCW